LSRRLAEQAHWPALDVLASISRVMPDVTSPQHRADADQFKRVLAAYRHHEDMISVGAYQSGSHPLVDVALRERLLWTEFLHQPLDQPTAFPDTLTWLRQLAGQIS